MAERKNITLFSSCTKETGVNQTKKWLDVVTAASGTYESTLKSEMAKSEAPTLFQVNGPVGLATWKVIEEFMHYKPIYASEGQTAEV